MQNTNPTVVLQNVLWKSLSADFEHSSAKSFWKICFNREHGSLIHKKKLKKKERKL